MRERENDRAREEEREGEAEAEGEGTDTHRSMKNMTWNERQARGDNEFSERGGVNITRVTMKLIKTEGQPNLKTE